MGQTCESACHEPNSPHVSEVNENYLKLLQVFLFIYQEQISGLRVSFGGCPWNCQGKDLAAQFES